jgi:hypothetical protein
MGPLVDVRALWDQVGSDGITGALQALGLYVLASGLESK